MLDARKSTGRALAPLLIAICAAACGAAGPTAVAGASGARAAPDGAREPAIALDAASSDVWAFSRAIEGRASGECAGVELEREGERGERLTIDVDRARDGRFRASVPLRAGENAIRARCERADGRAIESEVVRWQVRLEERPRARVRVVPEEGSVIVDLGASAPAEAGGAPIVSARWSVPGGGPLETEGGGSLADATSMRVALRVPPRDGEYVVRGEVIDASGARDAAAARFVVEGGRARAVDPMREHAAWIESAVLYGAVPFLFGARGLPSIEGRLDALRALGADTIWLSPVTRAAEGDYGYAVVDYFDVRPAYGTREDLRALVRAAHARGMRVVMDFVPNHSSDEHPYFRDVAEHGARSPYHAFYERGAGGEVEHYFDWENLPNLDYDHPEVRRWMREAFAYWARELDVDGFRVDAAWGLERRAPEVLAEIAEELYRIDPDLLLIAEASARDPYWARAGFAAAYDWTEAIGRWAWAEPFGTSGSDPGADVPALRDAIAATERASSVRVVRFLDNNDTGARFLTRQGAAMHDAAMALAFTLPGMPALFTGAEVGAEYEPYQREEPLAWEAAGDGAARGRAIARLASLRRALPVLRDGELELVSTSRDDGVIAFVRRDPEGALAPVLVAIDLSGDAGVIEVRLPAREVGAFAARALRDRLGAREVRLGGRGARRTLRLPGHGAVVIEGRARR